MLVLGWNNVDGIMFKFYHNSKSSISNLLLVENAVIEKTIKMNDNNNGDAGKFLCVEV